VDEILGVTRNQFSNRSVKIKSRLIASIIGFIVGFVMVMSLLFLGFIGYWTFAIPAGICIAITGFICGNNRLVLMIACIGALIAGFGYIVQSNLLAPNIFTSVAYAAPLGAVVGSIAGQILRMLMSMNWK